MVSACRLYRLLERFIMFHRQLPFVALTVAVGLGMTGCNNKPKAEEPPTTSTQPAFVEPAPEPAYAPTPTPAIAPTPAPKPLPAQTSTSKKSASSTATPAPKAAAKPKAKEPYVVQSGDTLTGIAKRVYGDPNKVKAIVAANPGLDPNKIKVGQKIILP